MLKEAMPAHLVACHLREAPTGITSAAQRGPSWRSKSTLA
jgi:hypothetical protein